VEGGNEGHCGSRSNGGCGGGCSRSSGGGGGGRRPWPMEQSR